jgi:hypothetical protein
VQNSKGSTIYGNEWVLSIILTTISLHIYYWSHSVRKKTEVRSQDLNPSLQLAQLVLLPATCTAQKHIISILYFLKRKKVFIIFWISLIHCILYVALVCSNLNVWHQIFADSNRPLSSKGVH